MRACVCIILAVFVLLRVINKFNKLQCVSYFNSAIYKYTNARVREKHFTLLMPKVDTHLAHAKMSTRFARDIGGLKTLDMLVLEGEHSLRSCQRKHSHCSC